MDVLRTAFLPVLNMINRQIGSKTPAQELCQELEGRVMAIRVNNTSLAAFLEVGDQRISLSSDFSGEPDVVLSGSALSLLRLAGSGENLVRDGSIDFTGDSEVAEKFQRLLVYGKPDLEEELSGVVGDVAAHSLGQFARSVGTWGRAAGSTMRQNVSEYLQEESRSVPSRYEVDVFRNEVDTLRDHVARFESRLRRLEGRLDESDAD
jgi:ubiquinone biosynthesis protein UbiJ